MKAARFMVYNHWAAIKTTTVNEEPAGYEPAASRGIPWLAALVFSCSWIIVSPPSGAVQSWLAGKQRNVFTRRRWNAWRSAEMCAHEVHHFRIFPVVVSEHLKRKKQIDGRAPSAMTCCFPSRRGKLQQERPITIASASTKQHYYWLPPPSTYDTMHSIKHYMHIELAIQLPTCPRTATRGRLSQNTTTRYTLEYQESIWFCQDARDINGLPNCERNNSICGLIWKS